MSYEEIFKKFGSVTQARINLGNAGGGLPSKALLDFRYDHALAKDAVHTKLDSKKLQNELTQLNLQSTFVNSQASTREIFLKRPDLGRKLDEPSRNKLKQEIIENDITIIIGDGLSSRAVQDHALPFLESLLPLLQNYKIGKIVIAQQARVALSDDIGALTKSTISIILIGERPGLSSPDSMGIYITYNPKVGNTDEKRNCISNIHDKGMSYKVAALKLHFLITESIRLKLSGVNLKDEQSNFSIE